MEQDVHFIAFCIICGKLFFGITVIRRPDMGKIFSWQDVKQSRVPSTEDFSRVCESLREDLCASKAVDTAYVFGSVSRSDYNMRSDIDCVVLYDFALRHEAFVLMQDIVWNAAILNVPMQFVPCSVSLANTRFHHFGDAFRSFMEKALDEGSVELIKGKALFGDFVNGAEVSVEVESWLRAKLYSLEESWCLSRIASEKEGLHTLKKAMEAPVHAARKILALLEYGNFCAKNDVVDAYLQNMPESLGKSLKFLVSADQAYTAELRRQASTLDGVRYAEAIFRLEGVVPQVLDFLHENIKFLSEEV